MTDETKSLKRFIRAADVILLAILLLIGAVTAVAIAKSGDPGDTVVIRVAGKTYGEYPLSEDREVTVPSGKHSCKVGISGGSCRMISSDCRGKDCVKRGRISKSGQSIVCLPNKVSVQIKSKGGDGYDAVAG